MSYLYVCEQGASIGLADNRFRIKCRDGMVNNVVFKTTSNRNKRPKKSFCINYIKHSCKVTLGGRT